MNIKYRLQSLVFVLVAFLLGCNEFMVVGVISNIAKSYHASLSTVGLLVTIFAITYAICTPILTTITSKYDRFKVLMVMLAIFWVGNTMTALAPSLPWLFISRIITAAMAGTIISLILVFVSVIAPLEKRSMLVAAVFSGFSTATIIGVPIGTTISMLSSWHISFLVISVLTILIGAGLYWLLGIIGVMFIISNTCAGIISNHYGIRKMPLISTACLALLLLMGLAFRLSWLGIALLCLICFILGMPGSILQVMFLNVAERDYPEAISLASSLNPICTNVGVSIGSLVAAISVNLMPVSQVGYVGALFALIGVICTMMLMKTNA